MERHAKRNGKGEWNGPTVNGIGNVVYTVHTSSIEETTYRCLLGICHQCNALWPGVRMSMKSLNKVYVFTFKIHNIEEPTNNAHTYVHIVPTQVHTHMYFQNLTHVVRIFAWMEHA